MTKKYVLKGDCFRLETTFEVDGEQVAVSFADGKREKNRHGYFVTDDAELQEAIESSASYGSLFVAEVSEEYPAEVVEETPVVEPVAEETTTEITEDAPPTDEPVEEVVEETTHAIDEELLAVDNYTLAKLYIKNKFPEVTRPEIISEDKLKQYAKDKGIIFPNW